MTPHRPNKTAKAYMKGQSDIPIILGRLRSSKRLTNCTQVPSQCASTHGATVQPINFSKPRWAGPGGKNRVTVERRFSP